MNNEPLSPDSNGDIQIHEVIFYPEGGSYEWVEFKNADSDHLSIYSNTRVTPGDENSMSVIGSLFHGVAQVAGFLGGSPIRVTKLIRN